MSLMRAPAHTRVWEERTNPSLLVTHVTLGGAEGCTMSAAAKLMVIEFLKTSGIGI